ncbi:MAG TPA: formylmethanofuran dehydrogenase subunit B, partial [Methanocorpusculum sp.]|nr:formylmethanofuran dehydrogenase subunit B [Methanocorpusculum sp.]
RETDTAKVADTFVRIKQSYDYEIFDALRTLLRGEDIPDEVGGVPKEKLQEVIDICKSGRFVTLFFGMGLTHTLGRNHNIDAGINFIRDLNDYTKAVLIAMRGHYNVTGAGQVLGWQYGFPFACDLSRLTMARHNPGETTSVDLLVRKEVDACVVIASDLAAHFPFEATRTMAHIPTITIDPHISMSTELSDLHIPVAIVGVEVGGCCYRMDNVPIETRKCIDAPEGVLTDEELFNRISARVDEILAENGCKDASEYLAKMEA